jgi:isocitrate/isopropylmalate dehydrogenase
MRSFAEACPDAEKVKQLVSQLPWGHVIRLLQRVKETEVREWYVRESIEAVTGEGKVLTRDLGGKAGTRDFTDAVLKRL